MAFIKEIKNNKMILGEKVEQSNNHANMSRLRKMIKERDSRINELESLLVKREENEKSPKPFKVKKSKAKSKPKKDAE